MSSIPQRKKSPEELAALRAQEFANLPSPTPKAASLPSAPAPDVVSIDITQHRTVSAIPDMSRPMVTQEEPVERIRKSPPLKHGQMRAFSGLRPEAARELSPGIRGTSAQLPQRKLDEQELQELRHRGLMQTRPPVQRIVAMQLHPFFTTLLYGIALAVIVLTIRYWSYEGLQRFYSPGAGCAFLLLTSLFLYFNKPRARHHAAILSGISLIVLGFVILLTLKNPYAT
ncbi:MAG: hypothetical protein RI957_104 [Verrucomicrobiota bacterium]|jgi:hypothetical protein